MTGPEEIATFWLDEVGEKGWYEAVEAVDATIRARFGADWQAAHDGEREDWRTGPGGAFAYLILTDQFPRNMFRDDPRAFATDALARVAAKDAIARGWDQAIAEPQRQFFYMPLMHSEDLGDQDRAVALFETAMPEAGAGNIDHAKAHREIIRRFGRFPFRNRALGRETTAEEAAFIAGGGYRQALAQVRETG